MEQTKATNAELLKSAEATAKLKSAYDLIGLTGSGRTMAEFGQAEEKKADLQSRLNLTSDKLFFARNAGDTDSPAVAKLQGDLLTLTGQLKELNQAELNLGKQGFVEGMREQAAAFERAAAAAQKYRNLMFEVYKAAKSAVPSTSTIGDNKISTFADQLAMADDPSSDILKKYSQRLKDLVGVYDVTRTSAEQYAIEVDRLNALFGDDKGVLYGRALQNIRGKYDESYIAAQKFGEAVGGAMQQGILMGRSWANVLDSLLVSIAQLIVKMYVLKSLQSSAFGSGGGFGGFLTGKAGGGYVGAGNPYMVGERGPELFIPNTSGMIVPNGAGGGGVVNQYFDGCVVTDDLLRKADGARMMAATEKRAIAGAVSATNERYRRGLQR